MFTQRLAPYVGTSRNHQRKLLTPMKRLIRRFVEWLWSEGVATIVEQNVATELRRRFPEEFRSKTPYRPEVITQDVYTAVFQHLPTPADVIHADYGDSNIHHVRTFTIQRPGRGDFRMVMIAARVRLAPELRSDEICCGRYVHLLNVEIHGWGNAPRNTPDYTLQFSLMQYRLQGPNVGGTVPYWRLEVEKPAVLHRHTEAVLEGVARGLSNF